MASRKWSAKQRAEHSERMKARYAAMQNGGKVASDSLRATIIGAVSRSLASLSDDRLLWLYAYVATNGLLNDGGKVGQADK